ncbi:MAG: DEAD/DEAH box helicase [Spirochaetaceae bacterium]|nr:DEAD/DEAH box helicase [Spirochaetaceae bacterium]
MPYTSTQFQKLASSPIAVKARHLLAGGKLWKFSDRLDEENLMESGNDKLLAVPPGHAGAYVMDRDSEPQRVLWNEKEWSCECESIQPCIHLAALLIHLAEKHPEDSSLAIFRDDSSEANTVMDPELNPQQDLLFFIEPDNIEKKSVLVLGTEAALDDALNHRALPIPSQGIPDISGSSWILRSALVTQREDGSLGPPREWLADELTALSASVLITLLKSDDPPVSSRGKPWELKTADKIRLHFEPMLSSSDGDPLYEPVVDLLAGGITLSGSLIPADDRLIILDEQNAVSAVLDNTSEYLWFIRLMLSRRILSASDIRAGLSGEHRIPDGLEVEIPSLPENLEILVPILVLKISSKKSVTDFSPGWRYKEVYISPAKKGDMVMDNSNAHPLGLRDLEAEEVLLSQAESLLSADLSWRRGRYSRLAGDASIPLRLEMPLDKVLAEYGNALIDMGVEIRLEDRPLKKGGALKIQARQNGDILELNTVIESGLEAAPLNLDEWLNRAGLAGTREAFFTLKDKDLKQLKFLKNHGMADSGFLSTSPENLSLIDAVYSEIEADEETILNLERKRSIYKSLSEFNPENYPEPPEEFNAELRPYQIIGYAWLLHLKEKSLGGCLADDMGLGKTVQTLAYLSRLKADGKLATSLMVGPVVTLANWEAEMRRFSPFLKYHRYTGPSGKRYIPGAGEGVDLIIVSYQTLRNDIEKFLDRDWDHIILDEAHYVKNSSSRTFKAVRSINAAHRISLTGTPLENHLNELWSQMSFLNPGLLGSLNQFIHRYVKPVENDNNEDVLEHLSEIVAPFILRRKKIDVLHDLPPKDETILRCDMTVDQANAYHTARDLYHRQITGLLSDEGLKGARIQIFTILSKLRQLAIHPPMAGEQFKNISSGKMMVLDNLMEEILEEDHKTLVFSQYLGALDRAEKTCRRHDWPFSRLTGSTKKREEPIRDFQENPDTRVFLLSLRAGGVGINLTAADYVILLDPWWNPAVEAQAVDRAHRMGQTRPVMAYRLITAGTIEEKVLELQEKKKNLIAGVLDETDILGLLE